MPHSRLPLAVVLLASLSACAGGGGVSRPENREAKDAAQLQVELAQGYMAQGDLETANEKLERALKIAPNSVDAHTLLAVLNERISRYELAEQHYRKALSLKPDGGAVNNNFGAFLCGQGRTEEANTYFEIAFKDPFYKTPALAYANAGVCAEKQGQPEVAERYFRRALELDRNNLSALFALARISFDRGDGLRARAFVQRYEALAQLDPEVLDLAARVEDKLGDAAAAADYRDKLKTQYPDFAATRTDGTKTDE